MACCWEEADSHVTNGGGEDGHQGGARAFFVDAPQSALRAIELPDLDVGKALRGTFDYIHLFSITQGEMDETFPKLKAHLDAAGMLWLSWPKARKLGTDLSLPIVIEIGYRHRLVESTCLRIDETWAGLKFTHPRKGKVYHNSYGTLPDAGPQSAFDLHRGVWSVLTDRQWKLT